MSLGKANAAVSSISPQGSQNRAETFIATPRDPTAVARVPAKNCPNPVPRESVKLKIENILPLFSGGLTFISIVFMFGPVIEAEAAATMPRAPSITNPPAP